MNQFKRVKLNHANLNREISIVLGTIAAWHWSEASKSTHIYTTGGIFPAKETPDQVDRIIEEATKGEPNG